MIDTRFNYKNLDDIAGECLHRHLSIPFQKEIDILYEPLEIAGRALGNHLAIHPMEGSDATPDGKPGELTLRRWTRFASGGAKLIWGEAAAVVPEGRGNPRQLVMRNENRDAFAELVENARQAHRKEFGTADDFLIGIQLTHAGRHCFENPVLAFHSPFHDRFAFLDKRSGTPVPPDYPIATDDFLERLEDDFVDAARAACEAGFDFVDLKQCHSYLLDELLAGQTRPGKYGGPFENRTRFVRNVIGKIADALGDRILIATRLNVYDGVPHVKHPESGEGTPVKEALSCWGWGTDPADPQKEDLSEPKKLVEIMLGLGVGLLSVSAGSPYWSPHFVRPFSKPAEGGYLSPEHPLQGVDRLFRLTAEMQQAFPQLPITGSGYSWLRQFLLHAAAANVARGRATIAGVGRTAIAYPDFAIDGRKLGGLDPKKVCLSDSMCSNMLKRWARQNGEKIPTGCPVRDRKYKKYYTSL